MNPEDPNEQLRGELRFQKTSADVVAEKLTNIFGSAPFLLGNAVVFCAWIIWNALPQLPHFDPYPFTFLTLVVSLEAIFLSIFVLMSQNRDARIASTRAKLDFEIDYRSEAEITKILNMLEDIQDKLDMPKKDDDEDLKWMKQPTNIERLRREAERE